MKLIRSLVFWVSSLIMGGGYLLSQQAFFEGTTQSYSAFIDQSVLPVLTLGLLVAIVIFAFIPEKEVESNGQ